MPNILSPYRPHGGAVATIFSELRRRNVFKVAVAYAVVAWLIAQVIAVIHVPLRLPDWFGTAIIVLLVAGFPIAILFAWDYELTPYGLKPTHTLDRSESIAHLTGRKPRRCVDCGYESG